ncbi:MAG: sugar ABC transporter substrate-binding protein [Oscillospiraceae bacterium]|nr:sugar ABC transporter substrate-binding protein [Oscillospiraceae bacterium]
MKKNRYLSSLLIVIAAAAAAGGCSSISDKQAESSQEIKTFTGIFASPQVTISEDNVIKKLIAEKTGAQCDERFLEDSKDLVDIASKMINSDDYTDFVFANNEQNLFTDSNSFIAIDEYWDGCDNLKNYFSEYEWNKIRSDDGHIYFIPIYSNVYMYDTATTQDEEAFWVQVKVLKWAGYPEITTLDEYFDLLEQYIRANPKAEDGSDNIGYEILTDGYLYFCMENVPQFLDGYPNDGCCIVDPDKLEAVDYNTTDTAKRWFKKLNEEYHNGIIDPDCFVMTSEEYMQKLNTGNVLGMVDQFWNFSGAVSSLPDECAYIPLGVVIDEGITEHYHSEVALNASQGIGVTVGCNDKKGAVKFINDLLDPEIHRLRFWGLEGKDYSTDSEGKFYFTDKQTQQNEDKDYYIKNKCVYPCFPYYKGMDRDGINAFSPQYQPSEFYKKLSSIIQECFSAYGVQTYSEMLNKTEKSKPWYPMWSYANTFSQTTQFGEIKLSMDTVKHEYLPKVIMSDDFESAWNEYMQVYSSECDIRTYLKVLTDEVKRCAGQQ